MALAACGTHPWSPWWEQEVIDTPHYRIVEGTLRYVAWRNNTFGIHIHVGVHGADRAMAFNNAMRSVLPDLLALSASSPWYEGRQTHLHSTRTQLFTRMFPRCGIPEPFDGWADYDRFVRWLVETRSIKEHTEIWWCVRPHQSYGTVELRNADALADVRESLAVMAYAYALSARRLRAIDEGEPLVELRGPPHRGEHVARDPLGHLGRADRLRARHGLGARRRARAARSSPTPLPRSPRSGSSPTSSPCTGCSRAATRRSARSPRSSPARRSRSCSPIRSA